MAASRNHRIERPYPLPDPFVMPSNWERPPTGSPQPQPPRKKRWPWFAGGAVAVIAALVASGSISTDDTTTTAKVKPAQSSSATSTSTTTATTTPEKSATTATPIAQVSTATDGPINQQMSDGDAATWLPPNKSYRCTYVSRQVDVKATYNLWVTPPEKDAITRVLTDCGAVSPTPSTTTDVPESTTQTPIPQVPQISTPVYTPAPMAPVVDTPVPDAPAVDAPSSAYCPNCSAVRAAGAAPIYAGKPGYSSKLDGDGDGMACE